MVEEIIKHEDPVSDLIKLQGCGPLLRTSMDTARPLRQQVLEYVRGHGQAARADITHALGISAGSTTTLTADLMASGFLREVESPARETGRGRPKVALEVAPDAAYVIGIKLAFKRHTAVLADFAGNVVADAGLPSGDAQRSLGQVLDETDELIARLLSAGKKTMADVTTIGIGLPGTVEHDTGNVAWSSLLQTREESVQDAFSIRFGVPVTLDNDANMLTLAELWFGEGRSMSDFAVVTIESGVGMGLVLGNQLYRGAQGMGLELGHTKVQMNGALCRCGQRGCLEAYVADYALTREADTALDRSVDRHMTSEETLTLLFEKAKLGNKVAETIFRRAGRFLSMGLSNVVQLFDPALIILSGARMQYDYLYADEVLNGMQQLTLNEGRKPCKVVINAWGDLVWARGASALALTSTTAMLIGGEARPA